MKAVGPGIPGGGLDVPVGEGGGEEKPAHKGEFFKTSVNYSFFGTAAASITILFRRHRSKTSS